MLVLRLLLPLACALVASAAIAQSKYSYLHQATNELFRIQSSTAQLKAEDVVKIAAVTCSALDQLLADPEFLADVNRIAEDHGRHKQRHDQLVRDVRFFAESFVRLEAKLLGEAGVSDTAAKELLASAGFLKNSIASKPDPEQLLANVRGLRNDVCAAAKTMHKETEDAKAQGQRRERVSKWSMGLGGLSLIAVDIPIFAPSAGAAAASMAVGGALVSAALAK